MQMVNNMVQEMILEVHQYKKQIINFWFLTTMKQQPGNETSKSSISQEISRYNFTEKVAFINLYLNSKAYKLIWNALLRFFLKLNTCGLSWSTCV